MPWAAHLQILMMIDFLPFKNVRVDMIDSSNPVAKSSPRWPLSFARVSSTPSSSIDTSQFSLLFAPKKKKNSHFSCTYTKPVGHMEYGHQRSEYTGFLSLYLLNQNYQHNCHYKEENWVLDVTKDLEITVRFPCKCVICACWNQWNNGAGSQTLNCQSNLAFADHLSDNIHYYLFSF